MKFNLSIREKRIFWLCVAVGFIFILYKAIYTPLKVKADLIEQQIAIAQKKLNKNLKKIQSNDVSQQQVEMILDQFKQKGSDQEIMSAMTSEIESVATTMSMRITDMKPKQPKVVDFYKNFAVSLDIDGELAGVVQFIHTLQSPPHMFYVEELRINRINPRSQDLRCQLSLSRSLIP